MTTASQGPREILVALSNPVDGRDEEFRTWYWETHVPEVLGLPGFVSARCHRLLVEPGGIAPHRYLTVYEVEGSALDARGRLFAGGVGMSDLLDLTTMVMAPFSAPRTIFGVADPM